MATEIERKFLLSNSDWQQHADNGQNLRQGYFAAPEQASRQRASVRVRTDGEQGYINIKSYELGISRQEFEYPIPLQDADQMLDGLCEAPLIEKTRYLVHYGDHEWEIDVFHGDNEGLVVAEIELGHEDEAFEKPAWLGEEVSADKRYYNVCLTRMPYKDW